MAREIRCKRIVGGRTYNTETSTKIGSWDGADRPIVEALYQTRHGALFLYRIEETRYTSDPQFERIIPLDPKQAQTWMEVHCSTESIEELFGEFPEAGEAEARITLRIPETLRRRIALLAERRHQSLNAWILRCVESCVITSENQCH